MQISGKKSKINMANETASFGQYKERSHALATEAIQRIIGGEAYQPKLVQGWVDSIGQDVVNRLRVCTKFHLRQSFVGFVIGFQVCCVSYNCGEERRVCIF